MYIRRTASPADRIDNAFDATAGARVFSRLDLTSAYHSIAIDPGDQYKTAFATTHGTFVYRRAPMGLLHSGDHLRRILRRKFGHLVDKGLSIYVDDLLIYTETVAEHARILDEILAGLSELGFVVNAEKSLVGASELDYLGLNVSADGVSVARARVAAIDGIATPRDLASLRSLLGTLAGVSGYVANYNIVVRPLHALTHAGAEWSWDSRHDDALEHVRAALRLGARMAQLFADLPVTIQTDASLVGVAGVLGQRRDGTFTPVAYYSRRLAAHEFGLAIHELELVAIRDSLARFRAHTQDADAVLVETDSEDAVALIHRYAPHTVPQGKAVPTRLLSTPRVESRFLRTIGRHRFTISHIPGASNGLADLCSRYPHLATANGAAHEGLAVSAATVDVDGDALPASVSEATDEDRLDASFSSGTSLVARHIEEYVAAIESDGLYGPTYRAVVAGVDSPATQRYCVHARVLFLLDPAVGWRCVVPSGPGALAIRKAIFSALHGEHLGAHGGIGATEDSIAAGFFWRGMRREIRQWAAACVHCARAKSNRGPQADLLTTLPPSSRFG